jgi:2-hydroxychromene-2-carboxylate isomerase
MPILKFFYAYRSPYSALAADKVFAAAQDWGDEVTIVPHQMALDADVAFADPTAIPDKVAYIVQDVIRLYGARGLRVGIPDPFDIDFTPAARATHAAIAAGFGLAFIREASLLRWSEGKNLTEEAVIGEAATRAGWQADAAIAAMSNADYDAAIAADKTATRDSKVFGVPFFIVEDESGQEPFWGQDRWAMMLERLGVSG